MGREVKRVPFDFAWPLEKVWIGYINPYSEFRYECKACNGTGREPEGMKVAEDFYAFDDRRKRWCGNITQDEVDYLVEKNRLWEWTRKGIPPTAAQVNEAERNHMVHDGINRMYLIEARCKRLGCDGDCEVCHGEGELWYSAEGEAAHEAWKPIEPPTGEGYQVWETVSEGSPISPVFKAKGEMISWLMREGYSEQAATNFAEHEFALSMVFDGRTGTFYQDIESCAIDGETA